MTNLIKPARLQRGDTIAAISISGGRAGDEDMLWRYELGKGGWRNALVCMWWKRPMPSGAVIICTETLRLVRKI